MAYLVKILNEKSALYVLEYLRRDIERDGRFRLSTRPEIRDQTIDIGRVRLTEKKPYCGQHPGECFVNPFRGERPQRRSSCLEYEDWIAFHAVVNAALTRLGVSADVTTRPMETVRRMKGMGGKYWIRRGFRARVRYDWEEEYTNGHFQPIRWWNPGTDDQFEEVANG